MKVRLAIATFATLATGLPALAASHAAPVSLSDVMDIHGLGFDQTVPGAVYVATHTGLLRANADGTAVALSQDRDDYMGFTPAPAGNGRILASGHPAGGGNLGVVVSDDGGATWTQLAPGVGGPVDFHAMTVSRADPDVIYGLSRDLQISRDGGTTWSVAGPAPDRVIDLTTSPAQADTLYAATVGGLMLSSDAGTTWKLIGPANVSTTMVETAGDGSTYAFFGGVGLFKLSPSDGKWSALASDFGENYILHLVADPADPAHLVAATDAMAIIESTDGGQTWKPFGT